MTRRGWIPALCWTLALALPVTAEAQDPDPTGDSGPAEHTVAVLRPGDGPLRTVGEDHAESVEHVFRLGSGNSTSINGHAVTFLVESTGNPLADSLHGACADAARRAAARGAVAIVGPVSSGCTRRVLELGLEIPVLSPLSTSSTLGGNDDWFFRTIPHDRRRLETFVDTAEAEFRIRSAVAIHEASEYGEGLLEHLRDLVPSVDPAHTFRWDSVFGAVAHQVEIRRSFRCRMEGHHALGAVFLLGSSDRMVEHVTALEELFDSLNGSSTCGDETLAVADHHEESHAGQDHPEGEHDPAFVLVGSPARPQEMPDGTWIIAESQVGSSPNLASEFRTESVSEDLYVSSLDAAVALRSALDEVLRPDAEPEGVDGVRAAVRDVLDRNTFASAERDRSFQFVDGEISPTPRIPIRRVEVVEERRVVSVNAEPELSWVEVRVRGERPGGHLEGPIVVELIPHGEIGGDETVAVQVYGVGDDPVTVDEVGLGATGATVSFTPSFFPGSWFPSSFRIGTDRTPEQERVPVEGLGWPASYLVALLSALGAAFLYLRYRSPAEPEGEETEEGGGRRRRTWSFAERCVAGLVIAFVIIHVAPLLEGEPGLSQIPIPRFGSSTWLNAFASGLLGGWLGLNPILALASGLVGAFSGIFSGDGVTARRRCAPAPGPGGCSGAAPGSRPARRSARRTTSTRRRGRRCC